MSDGILVALIGLLGSLIGSVLGVMASARLTQYRLEQLEKKVQAHNNLVERMYKVEDGQNLLEERIKVANHRIDDLEKGAGE